MADENEVDSLFADVQAAANELAGTQETQTQTQAETQQVPAEQGSEGRARDDQGRFKSKEEAAPRETLTLKEKPQEQGQQAASNTPAEQPKDGKPVERIAPPAEWKGAAKTRWERLPAEVQKELSEFSSQLAAERAEVAPLREMIDANRQTLVREAGSVAEGVRQLLAFHELSLTKPWDLIQHIARARGIDLRAAFAGQPSQGTQQGQPDLTAVIAQAVQQQMQPFTAQIEQRETQQLQSTIDAFAADPKHPYFQDVKVDMGRRLKDGSAKTLDEAYDQAIWANTVIRQQLQAAQAEEAQRNQAAEAERAKKAAAASLRGSPLPGASLNGAGNPHSSVHDDVRAAAAELAGA